MSHITDSPIARGTILIEEGTAIPSSFRLETAPYPGTWMSTVNKVNVRSIESEPGFTGWSVFYLAGTVKATAFGFDRQKSIHSALGQLTAGAAAKNCNGIEIDEVADHSFLGIPWISVSAHSIRIQKGQRFRQ